MRMSPGVSPDTLPPPRSVTGAYMRIYIWEVGVLHKCSLINGSASWLTRPISQIGGRWLKDDAEMKRSSKRDAPPGNNR